MQDRLIRVDEVVEMTSLSRTKIYSMVKDGTFPPQRRLSHKVAVWRESSVKSWMDKAVPDQEILG